MNVNLEYMEILIFFWGLIFFLFKLMVKVYNKCCKIKKRYGFVKFIFKLKKVFM